MGPTSRAYSSTDLSKGRHNSIMVCSHTKQIKCTCYIEVHVKSLFYVLFTGSFIQVYSGTSTLANPTQDLTSPALPAKETTDCFSFYYYIHGEGVKQIGLQLVGNSDTQTIWQRKESAGDMWHMYMINIGPQQAGYKVSKQNFDCFYYI